ncbi:MAG: HRDC domain-containing protein, partial [Acidimicrobiales bacterium]
AARPLSASQLRYAAADVEWLLELADAIGGELERRGRLSWAEEECELVRTRAAVPADPARAWWRLRDARQLRGSARGVAQEVAAWREERARRIDVPVRHVLPDLAVQAIAHRPPSSRSELSSVRGLEPRFLRGDVPAELLAAVERGRRRPEDALVLPPGDEVPRELRPAVALAMAWVAQLARDEAIDAATLATRADLVAFVTGDDSGRLASGWRAGLVGEPLRRLVVGDAAIAFDGAGGLVVEERSRRALPRP